MTSPHTVKILLVDDLEDNLIALRMLLTRDDFEIHAARSGRAALELLLLHDFALALLDVQMPGMDGFELAELMRGAERTRFVPIIFVTAGARDTGRVFRGYEAGAVDFLYKPLDSVLLGHKVNTFAELYRQRLDRERLADELREALRLNEMFVATVCHDLRSPLSTVEMGASILEGFVTDPVGLRTLARMRSSSGTMTRMLGQLYDWARGRLGGGVPIERRAVDFRALAGKVVDELRLAYPETTIALSCAPDVDARGTWDPERLEQVVTNLVGNACRYGAEGEPVTVTARPDPERLRVEVHSGGEIAADVRAHIFEPFRRGARSSPHDGLGLGLYIVREIVLAHGGSIDVASSRESGTTFRFELPREPIGQTP